MKASFYQWIRFAWLIVAKRRLPASAYDYEQARTDALKGFNQFCPKPFKTPAKSIQYERAIILYGKLLMGQAAFLKNSLTRKAGHLLVPDLNLAYIRNPKAASTSIAFAMLKAIYPELEKLEPSAEQINFLADVNLHKGLVKGGIPVQYFIVVRNPFERLVSVYRDFFETSSGHFIYDDYLFGILKKDLGFPEFVNRIFQIPDILKDQHLKPQHTFLPFYEKRNQNIKIFKLENHQEIDAFFLHYKLTLPDINKNPLQVDYRKYYDSTTLEKAYQMYAKDVHLFGYEELYENLKNHLKK